MSRWYRAYEGTVTDAKLAEAALIAGCSRSVSIAAWHCVLESAAGRNNGGSFDTSPRRVAVILCEPPATIESLFAAFRELEMLDEDGVSSWKRRQFESDSSTERSRKHRETKRNGDATLQQQQATPPDTETDTDSSEAKASSPRAWACPPGVDPVHWRDFLRNRKTKRLTNSETAYAGQLRELDKLSDDDWPPGELVRIAAEKGWGSINDPRDDHGLHRRQSNSRQSNGVRGSRPNPALDMLRQAAAEERAECGDPEGGSGAWPALPTVSGG